MKMKNIIILLIEEYKRLISQFSPTYIEMSEWYCGPETLLEVYHKIYKDKKNFMELILTQKKMLENSINYLHLCYYLSHILVQSKSKDI